MAWNGHKHVPFIILAWKYQGLVARIDESVLVIPIANAPVQVALEQSVPVMIGMLGSMCPSYLVHIYSIRSSVSLFNGRETFWLVMMPLGGGRAIITYGRLTEIVGGAAVVRDRGSAFSSAFCVSSSASEALGFLLAIFVPPFVGYRFLFVVEPRVVVEMLVMLGSVLVPISKMSANKEATSSSSSGQSGKNASRDVHAEKSVDKLNVREFREHFCIPNGVFVELTDGEVVTIEKSEDNAIFFTKEQFNVLMGCNVLSVLFDLDLSLLEVLFVYSIKKGKNDIHNFVASLPSLQLVTSLPDSTKGAARGHVLVKGLWAGLTVNPDRQFTPNHSLNTLGKDRRGKVVEWVEKASFDRLNRLFEIAAGERSCETLLSAQNLRLVTQVSQPYVLNILPRRLPKKVVAGEHFILKDLPFYTAMRKADAQARKARLNVREVKRQEGTLQKAPGDKRLAFLHLLVLQRKRRRRRTPDPSVLPSVSSGFGHIACLNGSGPSVPKARRLALLVEEATSVNQPGSPHPDADVAGASFAKTLPPTAPPTEETGAESQGLPPYEPGSLALVLVKGPATRRSRPARDLKSGINGRLQDILLETIEVSCSSAQEDHPEESETEMAEDNPTARVLVPDEGSPKRTSRPVGRDVETDSILDVDAPSAKIPAADFDHMKAFVSQHMGGEEELRSRLERAEASLSVARRAFEESPEALKKSNEDNEALRIELAEAKSREEFTDARLHEAEGEMAQLRGEMRQLRTECQ
ncbi:hypothetical protein CK203_103354 [Vitis vinifera]|uniref:Uncharacterized protein n=1 Tax=Vitis vinifera TaxID=29760 RepID=A0A438DMX2_VITVI|nr:hypothetical protein CK203_103354 [Vitis vinifera]